MTKFMVPMAISFIAGSFGYILIQFWLRPVLKYRRIKKQIDTALTAFANGREQAGGDRKVAAADLRRLANQLNTTFGSHLPDWYQLMLKQRDENPPEAVTDIMRLAGTRNPAHAQKRADRIKRTLKLT